MCIEEWSQLQSSSSIIIVSIINFQAKSLHKELKVFLQAAKSTIIIIIIILLQLSGELLFLLLLLRMLYYNSLLILIIGASSLFLLSCRTQEHYLEVELFGLAAMDLSTDGVVLSIHRTDL